MDSVQIVLEKVRENDIAGVRGMLAESPGLVHARGMGVEDRRSVLQVAAGAGNLEMCRLLVESGAEVYPNPMNQYPPVMEAAWNEHEGVVKYFLEEIPHLADGTNGLGLTINLAGRLGRRDLVRSHLAKDPLSVHYRGWIGDSPLHWPAHNNFGEIVSDLIDSGADIEADEINWMGGRPLHWASEHAPETVRILLEAGAEVNSRNTREGSDFYLVTPLIMNATQKEDCYEVTELLLEAGADIDAVDGLGKTALQHAEGRGLQKIIEVLRSAGG